MQLSRQAGASSFQLLKFCGCLGLCPCGNLVREGSFLKVLSCFKPLERCNQMKRPAGHSIFTQEGGKCGLHYCSLTIMLLSPLSKAVCVTSLKWAYFCELSFVGIWNSNSPRPFLYYQTWGTVSCGWTCRSRKGKLWCLQTAWCNAITPNCQSWIQSCVWHSLNWVYLEQCFSKHVPWKISSARRLHDQTNLDKFLLCFPSWCF